MIFILTYRIGLKYEIKVKNGKRNGVSKWWHKNGQLERERNYKDGNEDGLYKWWYENGQLESERYVKNWGESVGIHKSWYKSGQLKEEYNWITGLRKCWDKEGNEIECSDLYK